MKSPRTFALALVLAAGVMLAVSSAAGAVEVPPWGTIEVEKTVTDAYAKAGGTIHYRYEVTSANNRFTNVVVSDNLCSPVTPVLGVGGTYNVGDTSEPFGHLNGPLGEKWIYTCNDPAPAVSPGQDLTDTATVNADSSFYPGQTVSDTDTFTLEGVVLRKQVVLYWDFVNALADTAAANVQFPVNLYAGTTAANRVLVGTEQVKASQPLALWLPPGNWRLAEGTPPAGYQVLRGEWVIGAVPNTDYLDNTFFDTSLFDLALEKGGPAFAPAGPVTYTYEVQNTGPRAVTPAVTDNKCSPVVYASGDTTVNGKVDAGETWRLTCTYTPGWAAAFPNALTNTATVADAAKPTGAPWNLAQLMGGETALANNTDTYTLYPFVLRKQVGLYANGVPASYTFVDNTAFSVKALLGGVQKGTFTISENSPKQLWLAAGTWRFQEYDLPAGYFAVYPNATIEFATGGYPDWTHLNVTWSGCTYDYWKHHLPFLLALGLGGTPGPELTLLQQGTAAQLNEARYGTAFGPYTSVAAIKRDVYAALLTHNHSRIVALGALLTQWNNGVCR